MAVHTLKLFRLMVEALVESLWLFFDQRFDFLRDVRTLAGCLVSQILLQHIIGGTGILALVLFRRHIHVGPSFICLCFGFASGIFDSHHARLNQT